MVDLHVLGHLYIWGMALMAVACASALNACDKSTKQFLLNPDNIWVWAFMIIFWPKTLFCIIIEYMEHKD